MGCPSEVTIGDTLVFSICTHDPDTGILTDADSAPSYRVYEDEGTIALLTGTMNEMIDAGGAGLTTGFYTGSITCSAGNGFEQNKTYTIYIEATVDSDTGGIAYSFKIKDKTNYSLSSDGLNLILNGVWDEARSGHSTQGTYGESFSSIVSGSATVTTLSITQMSTDLTEDTDNHYNGRIIIWITGVLTGQATDITSYDGSSKTFTFTAITEAPTTGDKFIIV